MFSATGPIVVQMVAAWAPQRCCCIGTGKSVVVTNTMLVEAGLTEIGGSGVMWILGAGLVSLAAAAAAQRKKLAI